MQSVIKGEKRYIAMKVTRRKSGDFTIDTASYDVEEIQSGGCEIDNGTKEVYFLVDTTIDGFKVNKSYVAEFTVTIQGLAKILKGQVTIMVR